MLASLPDGEAQVAFTRTLRSVVDWRGQVVTLLDRCYLAEAVPTLIVWGDRDGVIPVAHAHRAHEAMPGSRLEVFPGAGHFPHHADHDRFVERCCASSSARPRRRPTILAASGTCCGGAPMRADRARARRSPPDDAGVAVAS